MTQFRFRLETLLNLREAARGAARQALAEAYKAETLLDRRLSEIEEQIASLRNETRTMSGGGAVSVDRLIENQRYEMVLRAERQTTDQRIRQLADEIEGRRAALVEADRQVRLLERYRDHQRERYSEDERRREVKRMDEVAQRIRLEQTH